MSDIDNARRTAVGLTINGVDVSSDINQRFHSCTWTDAADGEADDFQIKLIDRDNVVAGSWLNTEIENRASANLKGGTKATIKPTITQENWNGKGKDISLVIGNFVLDEVYVQFGMSGQTVTMKGTALDFSSSARNTTHTQAWESTTLKAIAQKIGARCGYTVSYLASVSVSYTRKEQRNQTDVSFLQGLCTAAGLSLKITGGALIVYDQKTYENKTAARTIKRGDGSYTDGTFDATLADTCYSACHVSYEDTNTGNTIEYTYTPPGYTYDEDNLLEITTEKVSSVAEAKRLAIARLREANKGAVTGTFTFPGDITLVAGLTVIAKGFGGFNGTYYIEKSVHTISKTAGYKTTITLRETITAY
jgi:phage protein D